MPWISAGASLLGGLFSSNSASSAASGQAKAAKEANELQKYVYDNNVKLNQPSMDAGNAARNRLMGLMGLGGTAGGVAATPAQSREQIRAGLLSKYTKQGPSPYNGPQSSDSRNDEGNNLPGPMVVDEQGLSAAVESTYGAQAPAAGGINSSAADYGSLMAPPPEYKQFTGADLEKEPGYQFGLDQGIQALDRRNAASGGYFSGAALKGAQRFGQDYAGTKYGEAFNRNSITQDGIFNRYNTNQGNQFNRLTSLIGGGQTGVNQVNSAGQNYGNNSGNILMGNANAQGAAGIAGANSWGNALTGASNAFTQNNASNSIRNNLKRPSTSYNASSWGDNQDF